MHWNNWMYSMYPFVGLPSRYSLKSKMILHAVNFQVGNILF